MRVYVAGATGVIGQFLVPGLIAAGHEVTASTRSPAKAGQLTAQGAKPVVVDGLDREAVLKAITAAQPEVIIHQMTALTSMRSFRNFGKEFAVTNELRSRGTDYLLEAANQAGARRFIAQSFIGWNNVREGSQVKTEQGPLLGGEMVVSMMTQVRGASNEKAKREIGWIPAYPSWRDGFPVWAETFKAEHAAA